VTYKRIRDLEESLKRELAQLVAVGGRN
jgi:hypothetical protein